MLDLDLNDTEEQSLELLPQGDYLVKCIEAEVKPTKANDGQFIQMQLAVVAPAEHEGRQIWARHMIQSDNAEFDNKNEPTNGTGKAVKFGKQKVKTFLMCSGVAEDKRQALKDVNHLVGLVVVAHLVCKEDSFGEKNEIAYYKEAESWETNTQGKPVEDKNPLFD